MVLDVEEREVIRETYRCYGRQSSVALMNLTKGSGSPSGRRCGHRPLSIVQRLPMS